MSNFSEILSKDIFLFLSERKKAFLESLRTQGIECDESILRSSVKVLGENLLAADSVSSDEECDIDEVKMTLTLPISTPSVDRYGDVVVPKGCLNFLEKGYLKNPVVFFSHRSKEMPIATARRPDGSVALDVLDDKIISTAYFHEETEEARAVWRLVAKKILRAASIGFLPTKASVIGSDKSEEERDDERRAKPKRTEDGERIIEMGAWMPLRFLEWDLLEYSIVPVPANVDCVEGISKAYHDGVIEGVKIPLSIRKSLEPFATPLKTSISIDVDLKDEIREEVKESPIVETPKVEEVKEPEKEDNSLVFLQKILTELQRHNTIVEAYCMQTCELLQKMCDKLDTKVPTSEVEEPKAVIIEEEKPKEDPGWKQVLSELQNLCDSHKKLDSKYFSLTGKHL